MGVMKRAATPGSRNSRVELEGMAQLLRNMDELQRGPLKKATRAGLQAGMTPIAQAVKAGVNSTESSHTVKRIARKTVGKKLKKNKYTKVYEARVGFGVGKMTKLQRKRATERHEAGKGTGGGVGLSKQNIHWFVLGTEERRAGGKTAGKRGRIDADLFQVVPTAATKSAPVAFRKASQKIDETLQREASKMKK